LTHCDPWVTQDGHRVTKDDPNYVWKKCQPVWEPEIYVSLEYSPGQWPRGKYV
jgi:hypothetical protein